MGFIVHRSSGVMHTVLGGVGPVGDVDPIEFEVMEGVKECHRIVSPYKLASRHFNPGGTVVKIKIKDVEIGGDQSGGDGRPVQRREPRPDRSDRRIVAAMTARRSCAAARSSRAVRPTVFKAWAKKACKLMREAADRNICWWSAK
jgi:3-deoxy-7-phosphoheptulonate synthase